MNDENTMEYQERRMKPKAPPREQQFEEGLRNEEPKVIRTYHIDMSTIECCKLSSTDDLCTILDIGFYGYLLKQQG